MKMAAAIAARATPFLLTLRTHQMTKGRHMLNHSSHDMDQMVGSTLERRMP